MAKRQVPKDDTNEIKKLLEGLYKIVQTTNSQSKEQVRINKELLKVMSLLQSGFAKNEDDARKLIEDVRDGLEIQDEYAIKWAKHRKAEQKDIDQILKKFRELEQIHEDEIDNAEDYLELLSDRYDIIEDEVDLSKTLLRSQKEILKVISDNKRVYEKIGGTSVNIDETLTKIIKKKVNFDNLFGGMTSSFETADILLDKIKDDFKSLIDNAGGNIIDIPLHFDPLSGDMDVELSKLLKSVEDEKMGRIKGLEEYFAKNTKLQKDLARSYAAEFSGLNIKVDVDTGDLMDGVNQIKQGTKEYQQIIEQLDSVVITNNVGADIQANFKKINDLLINSNALTEAQNEELTNLLKPLGLSNKLIIEQIKLINDENDSISDTIRLEANRVKIITKNLGLLKSTEQTVMKVGNAFEYISSLLPTGIGDMLGFSNVSNVMLATHKKGIAAMTDKLVEGGSKAQALKTYYKEMGPALTSVLNPMTLMVAGGLLLFKYVSGMTSKLKDMSSEMGISLSQSNKLLSSQLDILTSQENQFTTLKEIEQIQTEMIGSGGKFYSAIEAGNQKTILSISEMGKVFGYGVTQATKIHKVFSDLGADDALSVRLQKDLGLMSEMVGLSPQIIGKDLLDASEEVYTYFAGMPEEAAKAAIGVRQMGLSLKQAGQIAQKMLDLEGFMTDMYELNAMTSGGLDFSEAFDLGLMGEVEKMSESIMETIGTTADYNAMDGKVRMKLAKTMGMSVEELSKSVKMRQQLLGLSKKEQTEIMAKQQMMGDISNMTQDEIKDRLKTVQSTERLSIAWDKIKGVLIKSLIPLIEGFSVAIDAIMPAIDLIIGAFKVLGAILQPFGPLFTGFFLPLKAVAWVVQSIVDSFSGVTEEVGSITKGIEKFTPVLKGIGALIGTWYFGSKLLGGIQSVGSSFGNMFSGGKKQADSQIDGIIAKIKQIPTRVTVNVDIVTNTKDVNAKVKGAVGGIVSELKTVPPEIEKTSKKLDAVKKKNTGLFSNLGASEGFKTAREIGTKALSFFVIHEAAKFLGFGQKIGEGIEGQQTQISGAMDGAFAIGGTLLSGHLERAVSKVFEKRLEKKFAAGMEPVGKVAKDKFTKIGKDSGSIFDPLKEKSKNAFAVIANYAKQLLPKPFSILEQGLEKLKPAESISETIDTTKQMTEKVKKTKNIKETVSETIQTVNPIEVPTVETKPTLNKTKSFSDSVKNIFTGLVDIIKNVWKALKSTLTEIVNFVTGTIVKISKSIGEVVKNLLGGIADGLNKFKTNAIKGAAALLIVSGALWVTSKAMQNFSSVSWQDVAKGIITLGSLALMGTVLGKMSGQMIRGSLAIALLGVSLIPAAYAFGLFSAVKWGDMAKAGVAIVGLAIAAGILGKIMMSGAGAVAILAGAAAIAILGAALLPLAYAMKIAAPGLEAFGNIVQKTFNGVATVISASAEGISKIFETLGNIDVMTLMAIGPALAGIGIGLAAMAGGGLLSGIANLFGGDVIGKLEKLAKLAEPLTVVQSILSGLNDSLFILSTTLSNLDLSGMEKLGKIDEIGFDVASGINAISTALLALNGSQVFGSISKGFASLFGGDMIGEIQQLATTADPLKIVADSILIIVSSLERLNKVASELDFSKLKDKIGFDFDEKVNLLQKTDKVENLSFNEKFNPIKQQIVPQRPTQESTAQNINVPKIVARQKELEVQRQAAMQEEMEYNAESTASISTKKMEQLLQQMISILMSQNQETIIQMDGYAVGKQIRKQNNR